MHEKDRDVEDAMVGFVDVLDVGVLRVRVVDVQENCVEVELVLVVDVEVVDEVLDR